MTYCAWISELEQSTGEAALFPPETVARFGLVAVQLARAASTGAATVPGFALATALAEAFFGQAKLRRQIEAACAPLSTRTASHYAEAAQAIRTAILSAPFPTAARKELAAYFAHLKSGLLLAKGEPLLLTVQGMSGSERLPERTDVVKTVADLEQLIRELYTLPFSDQALHRRVTERNVILPEPLVGLVRQRLHAAAAGIACARDLTQVDDGTITVRAQLHDLADPRLLLTDSEGADEYRIDRKTLVLLSRTVATKWWAYHRSGRHVTPERESTAEPALTDTLVLRLARKVRAAQAAFVDPVAFAWVWNGDHFLFTEVLPIAEPGAVANGTLPEVSDGEVSKGTPTPFLVGRSVAVGLAFGPVRRIRSVRDTEQLERGTVAVLTHLSSRIIEHLSGVAAIVVETATPGHADLTEAKQLGVPIISAAGDAHSHLRNGQVVTVDGARGVVYLGVVRDTGAAHYSDGTAQAWLHTADGAITGTKLFAAVPNVGTADQTGIQIADGIGLIRGEYALSLVKSHPGDIVRRGHHAEYASILAELLQPLARSVYPQRCLYQLHDVSTAPYVLPRSTAAAHRYEGNPKLGYRGAHQLLREEDELNMELGAVDQLLRSGMTNVGIILPLTRTVEEVRRFATMLTHYPWQSETRPEFWVECETPGAALLTDAFALQEVDGIIYDVPAIAQLLSGYDAANPQVGHHVNHAEAALCQLLAEAVAAARAAHVQTLVLSEAGPLSPEVVEATVRAGVTGVTVPTGYLTGTRRLVASIEQRMLVDHLVESGD